MIPVTTVLCYFLGSRTEPRPRYDYSLGSSRSSPRFERDAPYGQAAFRQLYGRAEYIKSFDSIYREAAQKHHVALMPMIFTHTEKAKATIA